MNFFHYCILTVFYLLLETIYVFVNKINLKLLEIVLFLHILETLLRFGENKEKKLSFNKFWFSKTFCKQYVSIGKQVMEINYAKT